MRDDISQNLEALDRLMEAFHPELLFVESGGDNLAAQFSRELADYTIYVIDVSGGDKIPRKGGPGITQSDLLVINKTDLAPLVGADLGVMERDAKKMRGDGPIVFAQVVNEVGVGDCAHDTWRVGETVGLRGVRRFERFRVRRVLRVRRLRPGRSGRLGNAESWLYRRSVQADCSGAQTVRRPTSGEPSNLRTREREPV